MKRIIRNGLLGLLLAVLLTGLGLLILLFNPTLLYSRQSVYRNYTIYHDQPLNLHVIVQLDRATELLQASELYDPDFTYEICLNDGSVYPAMVRALCGEAFAWGFYHQVVLNGRVDFEANFTELRSFRWNLNQLIAHQAMHCQVYNTFGFWKSNPLAKIADWKWEGYPEYIARQKEDQKDLVRNIQRFRLAEKSKPENWITFADGTGTVTDYYKYWLMVQFCMGIKKMSFIQVLHDDTPQEQLWKEMMLWYNFRTGAKAD